MQPDSITQYLGLYLMQIGLPAPLAALTACMALVIVPLFIGAALVAAAEHWSQRRAGGQRWAQRQRGGQRWTQRQRGATRL